MTFWMCISTLENWDVLKKEHVWGTAKRYQNLIARTKKGDRLLIYTMQKNQNKVIIPSAVHGEYEVISDVFEDHSPLFVSPPSMASEFFPYRIKVNPVQIFKTPIEFKPLIPELSFIKNKTMWSGSIRTAMREIPEEDYQIIIKTT